MCLWVKRSPPASNGFASYYELKRPTSSGIFHLILFQIHTYILVTDKWWIRSRQQEQVMQILIHTLPQR
jgi:hypothetical protein